MWSEGQLDRRELVKYLGVAAMALKVPAQASGQGLAAGPETVYELRIYHLHEGKLPLLLRRFRMHGGGIFARLGMHGVGYWVPTDEPLAGQTFVYMLRHKSREAATASWAKFDVDPEWLAVKAESERDGPLIEKAESTFLHLTDWSPAV
jgi:hypothetical protein